MNVDHRISTTKPDSPDAAPIAGLADVDLRRYGEILLLWWREIVLFALGTVIVAIGLVLGGKLVIPPLYETSADIILSRVVSSVNLVDTFRTTTEDMQTTVSDSARREALVHLVRSGTIAEAVIAELGGLLDEEERDPATILEMIEAEAPTGTDDHTISALIRITVNADDPQKAAAIANAWARHYVTHINSVYNQVPVETFQSVDNELQQATAEYEAAELELEAFVAENRIEELQNQIDQKVALRSNYQEAQKATVISIVEQDRAARAKVFNDLVSTQTTAVYEVFNSQVQEKLNDLAQLYKDRDVAQRQLAKAQNLRQQITEGAKGQAPGTALALQLLQTQVYATIEGSSLPGGLTVNLGTLLTRSDDGLQTDIEALIDTLENYSSQVDAEITALSEQMLTGEGYDFIDRYTPENFVISKSEMTQTIGSGVDEQSDLAAAIYDRYYDLFRVSELARLGKTDSGVDGSNDVSAIVGNLTTEIQAGQAALAAEQSKQLVLTQRRDLAWGTYNTLSNKVVELRLARTAANTEVRFGSPAVAPNEPTPGISLLLVAAGAIAIGVLGAIFLAIVSSQLGLRPWMSRNQIT